VKPVGALRAIAESWWRRVQAAAAWACDLTISIPSANFTPEDDFRKLIVTIAATPTFLGGFGELEDHGERGLIRKRSAHGSVAHGRERAFDGARRPQMFPVLGREVVEGEERIAILDEAICISWNLIWQMVSWWIASPRRRQMDRVSVIAESGLQIASVDEFGDQVLWGLDEAVIGFSRYLYGI
jgi:hypothetical protein